MGYYIKEVVVNLSQLMHVVNTVATAEGFGDVEEAIILRVNQLVLQGSIGRRMGRRRVQVLFVNFQGANGLLEGFLSGPTNCHDLTGRLHLTA